MTIDTLISIIGLLLVAEGIFPFLSPHKVRVCIQAMVKMSDTAIRMVGLFCMLTGLAVLYFV